MKPTRSPVVLVLSLLCGSAMACHHDTVTGSAPPPAVPSPADPAARGDGGDADPNAPPGDSAEPSAPAAQFTGAGQYLPQATSVDGWRQSGSVRHATPHDLFQIMDGEAASYEQYGVRDYASAEYRAPTGGMITQVQVYEFADPLGAFGRYSLSTTDGRDPATLQPQAVHRGGGGFMGSTELDFWKGNHLVQVSYQDDANSDEASLAAAAHGALPRFAEAIERALPGPTQTPANPLVAEGMVWGGMAYLADDALGAEHTGPAWVGFYRATDGKRYRVGVLVRDNATDAQRAFAAFRTASATPIAHVGDEAFAVTRGDAGEFVVARRGSAVVLVVDGGVAGAASPDRTAKLAVLRAWLALPLNPTAAPPADAAVAAVAAAPVADASVTSSTPGRSGAAPGWRHIRADSLHMLVAPH